MRFLLPLIAACCWTPGSQAVETVSQPAREFVRFNSNDLQNGTAVPVSGWWLKSTSSGKRPVIVALHGCGGLYDSRKGHEEEFNARHAAMAEMLRNAGYHVLFPDSFTARGKRSICGEKIGTRDITSANRRGDVQGALKWLAQRDDVDVANIALLGWSHGGSTVLSAVNAARPDVAKQAIQPKAAIAFYPGCSPHAKNQDYRLTVPLMILMGANDDWTPPAPCIELEKRLQARAAPITLKIYKESYHDFDAPGMAIKVRHDVPNGVNPGKGVTVGSNPEARSAAYKELMEFLSKQLKPNLSAKSGPQ